MPSLTTDTNIMNIHGDSPIYNIKARISVLARTQLIQLSLKLLLPDMPYMDLTVKIERLDKLLY